MNPAFRALTILTILVVLTMLDGANYARGGDIPKRFSGTDKYSPPKGCPPSAVGSITLGRESDSYETGSYVNDEMFEDHHRITARYWRLKPLPKVEALLVLDRVKKKAYTTFGSVRRFGNMWCAFSSRGV
jgi:hypothetical protein